MCVVASCQLPVARQQLFCRKVCAGRNFFPARFLSRSFPALFSLTFLICLIHITYKNKQQGIFHHGWRAPLKEDGSVFFIPCFFQKRMWHLATGNWQLATCERREPKAQAMSKARRDSKLEQARSACGCVAGRRVVSFFIRFDCSACPLRCRGGLNGGGGQEGFGIWLWNRSGYKKPQTPKPCSSLGCRLVYRRSGGFAFARPLVVLKA